MILVECWPNWVDGKTATVQSLGGEFETLYSDQILGILLSLWALWFQVVIIMILFQPLIQLSFALTHFAPLSCCTKPWWKCRGPETSYICELASVLAQSLHLLQKMCLVCWEYSANAELSCGQDISIWLTRQRSVWQYFF